MVIGTKSKRKHFFSGERPLASVNVNPLAMTRSRRLNERTVNRSWSNLSTMKGGHALGTVNQSSDQVSADCSRRVGNSRKKSLLRAS